MVITSKKRENNTGHERGMLVDIEGQEILQKTSNYSGTNVVLEREQFVRRNDSETREEVKIKNQMV